MKQTINDCGMSIVLTTATTTAALLLGMITNVPAMRAFYIYAAPCVIIDFLYQITFFVALIVIDQQRKHSGRHDCFPCILSPTSNTVHRAQNPGACAWILTRFCGALERSSTLKILICVGTWCKIIQNYCIHFGFLIPSYVYRHYILQYFAAGQWSPRYTVPN